jgi:hypothetical protein
MHHNRCSSSIHRRQQHLSLYMELQFENNFTSKQSAKFVQRLSHRLPVKNIYGKKFTVAFFYGKFVCTVEFFNGGKNYTVKKPTVKSF